MLTRRLLAVLRNAVVWGVGWFLAAACLVSVMLLAGAAPRDATWVRAMGLAARVGVVGGIAGATFALTTILFYRGRRLRDLHWARFGLAGALVSATAIPLVLQGLNILSGDGMVAWSELTDDIPLLAILGGGAAALWLALAQRGERAAAAAAIETGPATDLPTPPAPHALEPGRTLAERGPATRG